MKKSLILISFVIIFFVDQNGQTFSDSNMKKIDSIFTDYYSPAPGASITIIKDGQIIFSKGYGLADLEHSTPADPITNYRLASVTKQFTAMGIMMLSEKGKLSTGDPLIKYFPDYPKWAEQIKIQNMLNHTSGIWDYEELIPDSQTIPVSDKYVYRSIKEQDSLYFTPGEKFQYSNTAYVLLGLIIETISGLSFSEFLRQNIFEPLGMKNTRTNLLDAIIPNRAYGYTEQDDKYIKTDQSVTSYTLGDGGIYSSVNDLYKWDQALYSDKLVSKSKLDEIFSISSIISEENNEKYGYGWYISNKHGKKCIWHSGNSRGFTNLITRFPDDKLTIIILTNRNEADLETVERQIESIVIPSMN